MYFDTMLHRSTVSIIVGFRRMSSITPKRLASFCILFVCTVILGHTRSFSQSVEPKPITQPLHHAWEVQPNLGNIWDISENPRAPTIHVEELRSSEIQQRIDVAQKICLHHDRSGFDARIPALQIILERLRLPEEPILVKRSMMSAACLLDDGSHAAELLDVAREDPDMQSTLERALIRWHSPMGLALWRSRLQSEQPTSHALRFALEGMQVVGEPSDIPSLVRILRANASTELERILAAHAIGSVDHSGGVPLAREVLATELSNRYWIAANLLQHHDSEDAYNILLSVVDGDQDSARRKAATSIAQHFPSRMPELLPAWLIHEDSKLRSLALQSLSSNVQPGGIASQTPLLNDPDADVRTLARKNLITAANNGLQAEVNEAINSTIDRGQWRGLEQAILMIASLRDTQRCDILLQLADHTQPEVHLHAAWALMELASDPIVVEQVFERCLALTQRLESDAGPLKKSEIIRGSFLIEVLGRNRFLAALPMLQKYIPKQDFKMGNLTRASAIWSIAQIKKGEDDPGLREQFMARMKDMPPMNPENYLVRFACILALGEFGFPDAMETLANYGGDPPGPLGTASLWAREQIRKQGK